MSDPGFREIHLSGKHVVFLFMAGAVAAVGIFLLGVSVGRGITKADTVAAQTTPAPAVTATETASPTPDTRPKAGELDYFNALRGKGTPNPSTTPAASPSPTPADPPAGAASNPSPTPSSDKAAAKPSPSATPAANGAWYATIDSFSSRTNAQNRLAELKKKGYDNAAIATTPGARAPYKVRVGPFSDKPAADAMKARLAKDGIKSIVSR